VHSNGCTHYIIKGAAEPLPRILCCLFSLSHAHCIAMAVQTTL
jgi:hypothetical protein